MKSDVWPRPLRQLAKSCGQIIGRVALAPIWGSGLELIFSGLFQRGFRDILVFGADLERLMYSGKQ